MLYLYCNSRLMNMYRPNLIANFFIKKSLDTGIPVNPMKLIKLVYISHGWYLALTDEDLINEGVQAWKYGAVIPSVYHKFKIYGNEKVNATAQYDTPPWSTSPFDKGLDLPDLSILSDSDKKFLNKMWEVYGKFDGIELSRLTLQKDAPWDNIWNKQDGKNQKNAIIPNNLIKEYFSSLRVDTTA